MQGRCPVRPRNNLPEAMGQDISKHRSSFSPRLGLAWSDQLDFSSERQETASGIQRGWRLGPNRQILEPLTPLHSGDHLGCWGWNPGHARQTPHRFKRKAQMGFKSRVACEENLSLSDTAN